MSTAVWVDVYLVVAFAVIGAFLILIPFAPPVVEVDWDRVVQRHTDIKVTMTLAPDAEDRWQATVRLSGTFGDVDDLQIDAWTLPRRRDRLKVETAANAFIDKIRADVVAAQSRKMRTQSKIVPL